MWTVNPHLPRASRQRLFHEKVSKLFRKQNNICGQLVRICRERRASDCFMEKLVNFSGNKTIMRPFMMTRERIWGGVYFVFALFLGLSLISFHGGDASLNRAAEAEVMNWMGPVGAYLADPLLQFFGLAAFFLPLVFLVWGVRMVFFEVFSFVTLRLFAMLVLMVSVATLIGFAETPESWLFHVGLGGGDW